MLMSVSKHNFRRSQRTTKRRYLRAQPSKTTFLLIARDGNFNSRTTRAASGNCQLILHGKSAPGTVLALYV